MWFKAIVFGVAIYGIYSIIKSKLFPEQNKEKNVESMLECDNCGAFFTKEDGVRFGGKVYCSKECKDKARG